MPDSSNITSIFSDAFDPERPAHVMADVAPYLRPELPPTRTDLRCSARRDEQDVEVVVTRAAQCAIAGTEELSTIQVFNKYGRQIDEQIALRVASAEPGSGPLRLDAGDIVSVI